MWAPVPVLAALLLIQLSAGMPGKEEDGSSAWAPDSQFQIDSVLPVAATSVGNKEMENLFFSNCAFQINLLKERERILCTNVYYFYKGIYCIH